MTRLLKRIILFPLSAHRPTTCSEAGKKGAAIRYSKERELKRAVIHDLCAGMGRPVPEVFR